MSLKYVGAELVTGGTQTNASDVASYSSVSTQITTATSAMVSGSSNGTATAMTLWYGSTTQYNAIGTKSATTLYILTS